MATAAPSKYALKSLHEEIALFDRKLAHLAKYDTFPSEKERLAAQAKMSVKRGQLVKAAQAMTDAGFEVDAPRKPLLVAKEPEQVETAAASENSDLPEPFYSGGQLDFRQAINDYKARRRATA